jgi:hypothetical protein
VCSFSKNKYVEKAGLQYAQSMGDRERTATSGVANNDGKFPKLIMVWCSGNKADCYQRIETTMPELK